MKVLPSTMKILPLKMDDFWDRRRCNLAGIVVIIEGRIHKLLYARHTIGATRELLLDYGENYWEAWRGEAGGADGGIFD